MKIFTIYPRIKKVTYKLLFRLKNTENEEKKKKKIIQPQHMQNFNIFG